MVATAVLAGAAAEAARVICDDGAVGEVRCQRVEAAGRHGLTTMNSGGRPSAVGSGP
jgi:hypothetical protein